MAFVNLSKMPTPPATRVANIPSMSGGLNIHDLPWHLAENQSPEMKNMWWEDGALRTRPGQYKQALLPGTGSSSLCSGYSSLFEGHYFFHQGERMWAVPEDFQSMIEVNTEGILCEDIDDGDSWGLPDAVGTFVLHDGRLYYKTRGVYAVIEGDGGGGFSAKPVKPFIPTLIINASANKAPGGDLYQPLNRLSRKFYVTYSPGLDPEYYYAPGPDYHPIDFEVIGDEGSWTRIAFGVYFKKKLGVWAAKPDDLSSVTEGSNTVRVTFRIERGQTFEDYRKTYYGLMSCDLATAYGGGEGRCIVLAGCEVQPNAYFWSANTNVSMDPTYFPAEHYNLAGGFSDPIVAFGQQQNQLVIFQKGRVGAAEFGTTEIDGRTFITMDYRTISPNLGCDLPSSVQLVENNLVFANTKRGVLLIRDTTSANENNIVHISDNIEHDPTKPGLLYDLANAKKMPTSFDDGTRYWLVANNHAWLWDYRIGGQISNPKSLSWFYFDGIKNPDCWLGSADLYDSCFVCEDTVYKFTTNNHGETFEASVALPVHNFGTYEVLKNVTKAIFAFDDSSEGKVDIEYQTDYGTRTDPTPINFSTAEDTPFAEVFVRKPRCLNVRHFLCRLKHTSEKGQRTAFTSAQIHYTTQGIDR